MEPRGRLCFFQGEVRELARLATRPLLPSMRKLRLPMGYLINLCGCNCKPMPVLSQRSRFHLDSTANIAFALRPHCRSGLDGQPRLPYVAHTLESLGF